MAACRHCGREARERDQFCQYCGHRLDEDGVRSEVAEPAVVVAAASGPHPTPALWRTSTDKLPAVLTSEDALTEGAASNLDVVAESEGGSQPQAESDEDPAMAPDTTSDPAEQAVAPPRSRLLIRKASAERGEEREEVLGERDIAVGRSPSCDIVLDGDELASRRHALIQHKAGAYVVVDLGSSNGTYINGYEIHEATPLRDGDRIAIGSHELIFAIGVPGPNASLAGERPNGLPATPAAATMRPPADADDGQHSAEAPGAAGEEEMGAMSGVHPAVSRAESQTAPLSAAKPEELEALRLQIADIAGMLAHRADEEARVAKRYHTLLSEVRDQLRALLDSVAEQEQAAAEQRARRTELAGIARDAAAHPRHLDYLAQLSERSGELAELLAGEPLDGAALSETLSGLLAQLDHALE
ncbi:MAG TPA: FHA domain-containing protein [Ktedonobacterales bacterium]|nr:FHA domain-containing protein [Ktedonobacterales bacterium]